MKAYAFSCARPTDIGVVMSLLESMRSGDGVLVAGGVLALPGGCEWSKIEFPAEACRKKGRSLAGPRPAVEPRKRAYDLALSSDRKLIRSGGFLAGTPQLDAAVLTGTPVGAGAAGECRIVMAASERARAYFEFLRSMLAQDMGKGERVCGPVAWRGNGEGVVVLNPGAARAMRGLLAEWNCEGLGVGWGRSPLDLGGPIHFREIVGEASPCVGVPQGQLFEFSEAMRAAGHAWVQWGACGASEMGVAAAIAQSLGTYLMCGPAREHQAGAKQKRHEG